jgi:hypothetical protein
MVHPLIARGMADLTRFQSGFFYVLAALAATLGSVALAPVIGSGVSVNIDDTRSIVFGAAPLVLPVLLLAGATVVARAGDTLNGWLLAAWVLMTVYLTSCVAAWSTVRALLPPRAPGTFTKIMPSGWLAVWVNVATLGGLLTLGCTLVAMGVSVWRGPVGTRRHVSG